MLIVAVVKPYRPNETIVGMNDDDDIAVGIVFHAVNRFHDGTIDDFHFDEVGVRAAERVGQDGHAIPVILGRVTRVARVAGPHGERKATGGFGQVNVAVVKGHTERYAESRLGDVRYLTVGVCIP